jgi:hypothetical protein
LKGLAECLADRFGKDVVVFRGPLLTQHLDALLRLLEPSDLRYRVLTMVRSPLDAVASLQRWGAKLRANGKGGPLVNDPSPAAMARFWAEYYMDLFARDRDGSLNADRVKVLRYEDLVGAPETTVAGIGSFLDLDLSSFDQVDGWKNSLVSYTEALGEFVTPLYGKPVMTHSVGRGTEPFKEEEAAEILRICRDVVDRYYADRS